MAPKSGEKKPAKKVVKKTGAGAGADKKKKASRKAVESYKIYIYKVGWVEGVVQYAYTCWEGGDRSATAGKPLPLAQHGGLAVVCSTWPRAPHPLSGETHLIWAVLFFVQQLCCSNGCASLQLEQAGRLGMSTGQTSGLQLTSQSPRKVALLHLPANMVL